MVSHQFYATGWEERDKARRDRREKTRRAKADRAAKEAAKTAKRVAAMSEDVVVPEVDRLMGMDPEKAGKARPKTPATGQRPKSSISTRKPR